MGLRMISYVFEIVKNIRFLFFTTVIELIKYLVLLIFSISYIV